MGTEPTTGAQLVDPPCAELHGLGALELFGNPNQGSY